MQPQDPNQQWQQPQPSSSGAPYQAPQAPEQIPPAPTPQTAPYGPEPTLSAPADSSGNIQQQPAAEQVFPDAIVPEPVQNDTIAMNTDDNNTTNPALDDQILLRWQAAEYVERDRGRAWYIGLGVVALVLVAVAIFVMKTWTFAALVPVMAVALYIYTRRPATVVDYIISKKGLYINDRLYTYDEFKAFSIISHDGYHWAQMIPRKRFQLGQSVYFPEEVGETLVDMLAARLPMKDAQPDLYDKIITKLKM